LLSYRAKSRRLWPNNGDARLRLECRFRDDLQWANDFGAGCGTIVHRGVDFVSLRIDDDLNIARQIRGGVLGGQYFNAADTDERGVSAKLPSLGNGNGGPNAGVG